MPNQGCFILSRYTIYAFMHYDVTLFMHAVNTLQPQFIYPRLKTDEEKVYTAC